MRDPNRIDYFLKRLGECWKKVPDWRFGQFICNIPFDGKDPFYMEDSQFIECVESFFKESNNDNNK